jgi:putative ABC transport system permease protein
MKRSLFEGLRRGFGENVRFALLAIREHKLRAFLTLLGIVVGVTTVIGMVSIVSGFNNNVARNFQAFGASQIEFQKFDPRFGDMEHIPEAQRRRKNLTLADADALKRLVPEIRAISAERYVWNGSVQVKRGNEEANAPFILGSEEDYPLVNNFDMVLGRSFTPLEVKGGANVCLIGTDVRDALFPGEDPIGKPITLNGVSYRVIGLLGTKPIMWGWSPNNHVVIPVTSFDRQFSWVKNSRDALHIIVLPKKPEDVQAVIDKGSAVLRVRRHVPFNKPNDFGINTPEMMISQFKSITGGVTLAMVFVAMISLLIGGIGVMNIMLVSVTERTREIGVRKAVGAFRRDIVWQFLTEATTLSIIGGVIGVALGVGISLAVRTLIKSLPTETPLWAVMLGLLVSMGVGIFFGLYPAVKASRLDPIESLRYE